MRVLILFTPIVLALIGTLPARAAQPTLTVNADGRSHEYTAAALLARPDSVSLSVPYDTVYGSPVSYRAVPLLALLGEIPQGRLDTLEALATDGFAAEIPLKLIARGASGGAVAWLAVEDPAHPWPRLPHRATSAGPFYLVWENPRLSDIGGEQWIFALASLSFVESPAVRWPQLALPAGHAADVPAQTGRESYFGLCLPCHQLNGGGAGVSGPDLGRPMNVTQYLTEVGLRSIIRDPRAVRTWPGQHMRGFDQTELPEADLDAVIAYLRAMALESIRATPSGDGATRSEHNGSVDLCGRGAHDALEVTGQMRLVGEADVGCNVGESALGSTYERIRTADTCLQLVLVRGHADGALEGAQQAKGGELSDGSLNRCLASVAPYKALGSGWKGIELPDVAADDSSATRQ
jgi:mono/diheme cytochrome c family protein